MLRPDDPWFLDEPAEDPDELLRIMPELRQNIPSEPPEVELGLRALFEAPGAFTHAWWRDQAARSARSAAPPRPRAA